MAAWIWLWLKIQLISKANICFAAHCPVERLLNTLASPNFSTWSEYQTVVLRYSELPIYSDCSKGRDMNSSLSSGSPSEGSPLLEDRYHDNTPRNIENEQASDDDTPKALYSDKKLHLVVAAVGIGVRRILRVFTHDTGSYSQILQGLPRCGRSTSNSCNLCQDW